MARGEEVSKKFYIQDYTSIQTYEALDGKLEESLATYLKLRVEQEGYAIKAEPTIRIAGYVKITESGLMPTDKESADLVNIYIYVEGIEKELI